MDLGRVEFISKLAEKGQSTVEYILLFAVVIVILASVVQSDAFQGLFGREGKFSDVYKRELEYSYRHGLAGRERFKKPNYRTGKHDSYNKRFFGPKNAYP